MFNKLFTWIVVIVDRSGEKESQKSLLITNSIVVIPLTNKIKKLS